MATYWERAGLMALLCVMVSCVLSFVFVCFGVLCQVRYLILSISDLCLLLYFGKMSSLMENNVHASKCKHLKIRIHKLRETVWFAFLLLATFPAF